MLMRLILFVLQVVGGYYGAIHLWPRVAPYVKPYFGDMNINIYGQAVVIALIFFVLGLLFGLSLREVRAPRFVTLIATVVLALLGAFLTHVGAIATPVAGLNIPMVAYPLLILPLAGAALGYLIKP